MNATAGEQPRARQSSAADRAWTAARWLYAAFWIAMGALVLYAIGTGLPNPIRQPTPEAQAFHDAMDAWPALGLANGSAYLAGGLLVLFRRTTPLGLALLAPAVTVILLFHLTLSGQYAVGLVFAAYTGALMWRERAAYASLWGAAPRG